MKPHPPPAGNESKPRAEVGAVPGPGAQQHHARERPFDRLLRIIHALEDQIDLPGLMEYARTAVRETIKADGVTFVLKEGDQVYYADEDSIEPLWKGQHFPLEGCIPGRCIVNREQIAIYDIYRDSRVRHEAYRNTFVKSMVMTPIGRRNCMGALGVYWARRHRATPRELALLQALADSISLAIHNVKYGHDRLCVASDREAVELASLYRQAQGEIAALKQAEKTLRFLELVFEGAPSMMAVVNSEYRFEQVNPSFIEAFRLPREAIVGRHAADVLGTEQFDRIVKPHLDRSLAGQRVTFEGWMNLKDGGIRYLVTSCFPIRLAPADIAGVAIIAPDLTEHKLAEERQLQNRDQLKRSQRELRALSHRLLDAVEEERRRIARELHDGLDQDLAEMSICLDKLAQNNLTSPDIIEERLQQATARLAELSDYVHDLAHALRPASLELLGLEAALEAECAEFSRRIGIPVDFAAQDPALRLPEVVQTALFRVAQECLRNIARHSRARHAALTIVRGGSEVRMSICDDGQGFVIDEAKSHGIGIVNMTERMRLVGGSLTTRSSPGHGTQVEAVVPLSEEE